MLVCSEVNVMVFSGIDFQERVPWIVAPEILILRNLHLRGISLSFSPRRECLFCTGACRNTCMHRLKRNIQNGCFIHMPIYADLIDQTIQRFQATNSKKVLHSPETAESFYSNRADYILNKSGFVLYWHSPCRLWAGLSLKADGLSQTPYLVDRIRNILCFRGCKYSLAFLIVLLRVQSRVGLAPDVPVCQILPTLCLFYA